ncbi:MAG TPA: hypothetical protein VGZ00_08070 [Candidatus Baltobacteraceae bacterium]|jgi:hypothetical protein|nr:hypothetical protein [Candidatus Baltobacteraceae bacterium]
MQHVSSFVSPKPGRLLSEDVVSSAGNCVWLLDAATPPHGKKPSENTQLYVHALSNNIYKYIRREPNSALNLILAKAIGSASEEANFDDEPAYLPYSTVILARKKEESIDYLVLGDSYLLINDGCNWTTISDDRLKACATTERQAVRSLTAKGVDQNSLLYREAHNALVQREAQLMNHENGFWVACDNPEAAMMALCGTINVSPMDFTIFAMSDGLARANTHLRTPIEFPEIPETILKLGATAFVNLLRASERDFGRYLGVSSSVHDDISYIQMSATSE